MLRTISKRLESVLFSAAAMGTIDSRQSAGEKNRSVTVVRADGKTVGREAMMLKIRWMGP